MTMTDNCTYCGKPLGGTYQSYWGNPCHYECNPDNIKADQEREFQRKIGRGQAQAEIERLISNAKAQGNP